MSKWITTPLGDIFEIARGGSPRPIQNFLTDDPNGLNWIMIGDTVDGSKYIMATKKRIRPEGLKKSRMVHEGDFLLTNSMSFGRPYILKTSGCIHDGWLVLSPRDHNVHSDFFYYLLGSGTLYREFSRRAAGAVVKNLNTALVRSVEIPFPPLAEQKRIAAILDAADALRAKRRETLAQLDTLLQSTFLDMFGDPVTNPMGWGVVPFNRIGKFTSGATPSKIRDDFWNGLVPWVSPKDMKVTRILDSQDHVSDLAIKETNLKLLDPGNLLIVVRGMILVHSFPIAMNVVPVTINQDMKGILPNRDTEVFFLLECIRYLKRQILSEVSTAGHGTKRFDVEAMKKILIPLPPLDLQRRFATIVESVEKQKTRLRTHLADLDALFASLQSRAFNGEL